MRNFQNYAAEKYNTDAYEKIEEGIYKTKNPYGGVKPEEMIYVTSLTFEMEPDSMGRRKALRSIFPRFLLKGF